MARRVAMYLSFIIVAALAASPSAFAQATVPATTDQPHLAFEVVTVRPTGRKGSGWRLQPTPDGYTAMNVSLRKLVQEAYGIFDDDFLTGGPSWIDIDKFDLVAKFDPAEIPGAKNLTYRQRADMLRAILADRFQLKAHFKKKDFPVYNLVVAKGGPRLEETPSAEIEENDMGLCASRQNAEGRHINVGCTITNLTQMLRRLTGRTVLDRTGLSGRYNYALHATAANAPAESADPTAPSVFSAVEEQLGLKLEPAIAPLDVLVIDSAERPSEN